MPGDRKRGVNTGRELKYFQAINEATDLCMKHDSRVFVIGLGVPDPKGVFGTTLGLEKKYGSNRVMDMPASENAMTGVIIGSALAGMRPVMTHQRVDFAILAMEQIVNQAAKWHYMFAGKANVPIVIRLVIGRGWGQGPQHSQSLESWFAHIPGLKVVMPTFPSDAKGLLISSIEDNNPVIFIEHRWLHNISGNVPEGMYRVEIGSANVIRKGTDITIVASSYNVLESLKAAEILETIGINAEIIDIRSLRPIDDKTIMDSITKTGRLLVIDTGWKTVGFGAEIVSRVTEQCFDHLKNAPARIGLPDYPTPTSPALASHYYPRSSDIVRSVIKIMSWKDYGGINLENTTGTDDIPDPTFTGPF